MNETAIALGVFLFWYQRSHGGEVHPKDVIEALEGTLKEWKFWYGEKGEKAQWCPMCGFFCECKK